MFRRLDGVDDVQVDGVVLDEAQDFVQRVLVRFLLLLEPVRGVRGRRGVLDDAGVGRVVVFVDGEFRRRVRVVVVVVAPAGFVAGF